MFELVFSGTDNQNMFWVLDKIIFLDRYVQDRDPGLFWEKANETLCDKDLRRFKN
jgi:hypothetical protein